MFWEQTWKIITTYWPMFLRGAGMTLFISIIGTFVGSLIGLIIGVIR
ncbi:MAG TPA: amino acid ABC transporter permease, partial [Clostridiales bacterium]|nr:amino acid ABC transporter permease [Clostridiales bacterium]